VIVEVLIWPGKSTELVRLLAAIENNCECPSDRRGTCAAHRMLVDQRVLNHLDYVSQQISEFRLAEWHTAPGHQ